MGSCLSYSLSKHEIEDTSRPLQPLPPTLPCSIQSDVGAPNLNDTEPTLPAARQILENCNTITELAKSLPEAFALTQQGTNFPEYFLMKRQVDLMKSRVLDASKEVNRLDSSLSRLSPMAQSREDSIRAVHLLASAKVMSSAGHDVQHLGVERGKGTERVTVENELEVWVAEAKARR